MRPTSGASTRSRRDEVWETKRQRWLQRQRSGGVTNGRPPSLDFSQAPNNVPQAPHSPLSKLVAEGYGRGALPQSTAHQPYGERPSSGSRGPVASGMPSYSAGTYSSAPSRGPSPNHGFDANVASQWNTNVQRDVQNRQNRHDPSVAGPHIPTGGQRVTQAPGGGSSIDLSWGGAPQGPSSNRSGNPPRMPGGVPQQAATPNYMASAVPAPFQGQSHPQRGNSPARGSGFAAPWGRDDDAPQQSRPRQVQRDAAPFGVDGSVAAGSRAPPVAGSRRTPSSPFGGDGGGAACAIYGGGAEMPSDRRAYRPPGGASSIVFG